MQRSSHRTSSTFQPLFEHSNQQCHELRCGNIRLCEEHRPISASESSSDDHCGLISTNFTQRQTRLFSRYPTIGEEKRCGEIMRLARHPRQFMAKGSGYVEMQVSSSSHGQCSWRQHDQCNVRLMRGYAWRHLSRLCDSAVAIVCVDFHRGVVSLPEGVFFSSGNLHSAIVGLGFGVRVDVSGGVTPYTDA